MTNQNLPALTVLVADQSEIFRRGILRALQDAPGMDSIWDGELVESVEATEALQPDVALIDIGLPQQRGSRARTAPP